MAGLSAARMRSGTSATMTRISIPVPVATGARTSGNAPPSPIPTNNAISVHTYVGIFLLGLGATWFGLSSVNGVAVPFRSPNQLPYYDPLALGWVVGVEISFHVQMQGHRGTGAETHQEASRGIKRHDTAVPPSLAGVQ